MTRVVLICVLSFVSGCRSGYSFTDWSMGIKSVNFQASEVDIENKTPWFSEELQVQLDESEYVNHTGQQILEAVFRGYPDQMENFEESIGNTASDISFRVTKISVKRGLISLDFSHPGPFYRLKMEAEIVENGEIKKRIKVRHLVNVARVNFSELSTKWMSREEKNDLIYQEAAFRYGLRKLYQELYFEYFEIDLQL